MDKFIKLTRLESDSPEYSNKPVYVSTGAITTFYWYIQYTVVTFSTDDDFIKVQETPDQILELIKATE
ncbi:hypothetical protein [Basfia succiniciproducens]|uniref:hypothetical protein n=1 Tax=Basfia succiniciproducens TaxID=653940 RepID=UPI0008B76D45|nr:hypothetical protein [Basfia succiniciproducens]SEQ64902.1 hypothetical protein SAMN02910415_01821 [Basfia succiniciproducens]